MATYQQVVADRVLIGSSAATKSKHPLVVADTLVVGQPRPAVTYRARVTVAERIKLRATTATNGLFHYALRAGLRLRGYTGVGGLRLFVSAAMRFGAFATARQLIALSDRLKLHAGVSAKGFYAVSIADALRLTGISAERWAVFVTTRLGLSASVGASYTAIVKATEELILEDASRVFMRCVLVAADDIAFGDNIMGLRAIYRQSLVEVVDFEIRLRQANGTITTWAMNARTGALTEYQDYAYTSIIRRPDGTYLGAGSDGHLYILQGGTDNGSPIVADIVGGMLDMGGSKFTQLKAVYLGVRVAGSRQQFFLKLTTNNGVTRTYSVIPKSETTARFDIGKGLRSRYVQWELLSSGQDFDLDDIEFVPLVSTRRI